jgi:hypothetical protein
MTTSPPFVSRMSKKCGNLDVSQPYGPPLPDKGIALLSTFTCIGYIYHLEATDMTIIACYEYAHWPIFVR